MLDRHGDLCVAPAESLIGGALLGSSLPMQEVFRLIARVAPTEASVLLTGESGCGKELVAAAIHAGSARRSGPLVAVNCGAIPPGLIEAELFGHERGSFTGAIRAHAGVFERARGGTLLLDEITEMPQEMQTRLLRVLDTRTFYRVGASTELTADLRVIAATNRCPLSAVGGARLRADLLYRLAVFPIDLPPLRARGDDVALLAEHFLAELNEREGTLKQFSALARSTLKQHSWPGNVRELRNCVERAFILTDEILELAPLSAYEEDGHGMAAGAGHALEIRVGARIEDMERRLIEATLGHFQGNKRATADTLGCSLKTLYNKLHAYSQLEQSAAG